MVPLDRAMKSFCSLLIETIFICSGLAADLNARLLPAAITHVRRITVSYPNIGYNVRYSSVIIACTGHNHCGKSLFSATECRALHAPDIDSAVGPP